jgi:hypothetical protein
MHPNRSSSPENSDSSSSEDRCTEDIKTLINQKSNIADQRMEKLQILPMRHKIHKKPKSAGSKGSFAAMKNKFFEKSDFQKINQNCVVVEREMP